MAKGLHDTTQKALKPVPVTAETAAVDERFRFQIITVLDHSLRGGDRVAHCAIMYYPRLTTQCGRSDREKEVAETFGGPREIPTSTVTTGLDVYIMKREFRIFIRRCRVYYTGELTNDGTFGGRRTGSSLGRCQSLSLLGCDAYVQYLHYKGTNNAKAAHIGASVRLTECTAPKNSAPRPVGSIPSPVKCVYPLD
jgi:hypothetical protein